MLKFMYPFIDSKARMCGSPSYELVNPSGTELLFHSDSVPNQARGFKLSYSNAECSRNYTSDSGIIISSGYPNVWNPDRFCNISIQTAVGRTISLFFNRLSIFECGRHSFKVYDGNSNSAPLLLNNCYTFTAPDPVFSSGNSLYIEANMTNGLGVFYMNYMTTDQSRGCGGNIIAERGVVSSPLYPRPINMSSLCMWYIAVPGYHTVNLQFFSFNLTSTAGCTTNYLEVYDGQSGDSSERVARYCGSDRIVEFNSRNNGVMIKLVTDSTNSGSGFLIHFKSNLYFPSSSTPLIQREDGADSDDYFVMNS